MPMFSGDFLAIVRLIMEEEKNKAKAKAERKQMKKTQLDEVSLNRKAIFGSIKLEANNSQHVAGNCFFFF